MTVRDSIEKVTFVDEAFYGEDIARFSPDGRHFFVITTRRVLKSNQVEATIWLFDSEGVSDVLRHSSSAHSSEPRALVKMSTSSNGDPITVARWAADGESIAFLGRNKDSERHLFIVKIKDSRLRQLSPDGQDVTGFDRAGDTFIFTAVPPVSDSQLYQSGGPTLPDIQIGTGMSLFDLLYPAQGSGGVYCTVWQVGNGKTSPVIDPASSTPISLTVDDRERLLSLSPSGRYAVVTNPVAHVPPTWESYEVGVRFGNIVADKPNTKRASDDFRPLQYELIDLQSGKMSVLVDAPLGASTGFVDAQIALWSQNERAVILTNTFLPLEGKSGAELYRSTRPWVVAVDMDSRQISGIRETTERNRRPHTRLTNIEWYAAEQQLVLRYFDYRTRSALEPEIFQRENGAWKAVTDPAAIHAAAKMSPSREFSVDVRQSVNEPPVLMVTNVKTGKSKTIWNPNPQFAGIKFGEAMVYMWHDKAGNEWTGGLVKPPDYTAGRRYPLVIQTHGFNPKEFLTDGQFTTANAARPMAARGIIVLQVGEINIGEMTSQEPVKVREGYVAAIEQLDADGLIDSQRVGIIGYSRTGWSVLNSLIHAGKYFAAATLAESTYISFGEYTLNADYSGPARAELIAAGIGTEPFGSGLQKWISDSPGFNTDKIHVPVLFETHSPLGMIYGWDMYALMRLQKKPVELLYFRNGDHVLTKPLELLASQETSVDWYDFWLNGHEDSDPAKAEQYARWRELRKMQQENENELAMHRATSN